MPDWTDSQKRAIYEEGSNIIVSAGAGSGKTAVLTERVINKLVNGVDINHLLVLTFTNAAAAEMKDRIRKAIKEQGLTSQLDYIDAAYITTFDSYAGSIVRKYHYLLNIPSNFKVIDDTVLSIYKNETIDNIFERRYGNKDFEKFVSMFCEKDDNILKKMILEINDKLDLRIDKEFYLDSYIDIHYNNEFINSMISEYGHFIKNTKDNIKDILKDISLYVDTKFYDNLSIFLKSLLEAETYEDIRSNLNLGKFPISPRGMGDDFKKVYEKLKKEIATLSDLCHYSLSELKDNLLSTKDTVSIMISLIKELSSSLDKYKYENISFTFTDIAKMSINIIKNNEEVREELKEFYNEIMVDEYQDTSDLQEEFISLISNNNVYMVGDVKQSIYRFRNANPDIFKSKYNNYALNVGGKKIDLLENFRSRSEVLENINDIFDYIMDDKLGNAEYKKSHRMIFGNKLFNLRGKNSEYNMNIYTYDNSEIYNNFTYEEIEAFIIANDIKEKISSEYMVIDKDTKELRKVNYGDFCIIMDRGSAFETYSKIFEYLSIPIVIWQDEKLNNEEDITILKNIINFIIKVKDNIIDQEFKYYFTSIARSYLFSYKDEVILTIFKNNTFKDTDIYKLAYDIANDIDSMTNVELLDMIIDKFNLYEKGILKGDIESSIVRFGILHDLFNSLSSLGYTPLDLPLYFKNIANLEIKYSLDTKVPDSVNIMNIHKSKGLEFSICYFAGYTKTFNTDDIKENFIYDDTYGLIVPFYKDGIGDTVLKTLYKNKYIKEDISERIRLLYVALTRAKEKMIIVSPPLSDNTLSSDLVLDNIRLKYSSFYDILGSLTNKINKYIKPIDLEKIQITKDYDFSKKGNKLPNIFTVDKEIEHKDLALHKEEIIESHYSKTTNVLHTKEEIKNMEYGTYIHYLLETTDFNNPQTTESKVLNFIDKLDLGGAKIYKEYEFIYEEDNNKKHGIIDLMLEYNNHIDIIDYKLKNITDENYYKQVNGYRNYISKKTGKPIKCYLYSIIDEVFKEIN